MTKRSFPILLLVTYAAILFKVLVLKDMPNIHIGHMRFNFGGTHEGAPNLVPFKTIRLYLSGNAGWLISGLNILGNIGLLVPIGFLLPFAFPAMNWKRAVLWSAVSGLVLEGSQVLLHVGIFDIDDVILNGLGVMIGYWLQSLFVRLFQTTGARAIALVSAALIMMGVGYTVVKIMQGGREPHPPRPDVHFDLPDSVNGKRNGAVSLPDPCGGTGGTGRIVHANAQEITIRRKDGVEQVIHLNSRTEIRSVSGNATVDELKEGNAVTIVTTMDSADDMVAAAVLICKLPEN